MPAYRTRTASITCIIGRDTPIANDMDRIIDQFRDAPPAMLLGGDDNPYHPDGYGLDGLTPEKGRELIARMQEWNRKVYAAGVRFNFPYICNCHIYGRPDTRTGMWYLYDHWDEHADIIGPKPPVEPEQWMQREPDGKPHHNYPYRWLLPDRYELEGCVNNPHWDEWLQRSARFLVKLGYNGTFIDNNIHHCYCEHCQRAFHTYLEETYTPEERLARFGTADVSGLALETRGNKVLWARDQREYLERAKASDPEHFAKLMGTDDIDRCVPSEAGNGFHWGRSHDYWVDSLRKSHSEAEVAMILRTGDVSSLGIETPVQRCLWADTQKFWAWSIAKWHDRFHRALNGVCPEFILNPNWGAITGFRNVDSRRLEGKNVRLWANSQDIIFYEQNYLPCTLAPGYTLDLVIAYKYSNAAGARASVLAYFGLQYRALAELAMAEAATWSSDGIFIEARYKYPETRNAYGRFYEQHADWYAGRSSHARVGILYDYDNVHMENTYHIREVYALAHYCADNHILFDLFNEANVTLDELRRFNAVIIPHVEFLSAAGRNAILEYAAGGGKVLITGNTGVFDQHGRPVAANDAIERIRAAVWPDAPYAREGNIAAIGDIFQLLPKRVKEIHDIVDINPQGLFEKGVYDEIVEASKRETHNDARLATLLSELAGFDLRVLPDAPATLRVSAWAGDEGSLVVHFLNYNVPVSSLYGNIHEIAPEQVKPVPVENAVVSLPLPTGMRVSHVEMADPWHPDPEPLPFILEGGRVRFTVPRVDIYRAVRLS
ncbi:MAG: hypothetical protein BWY06_00707 [Candidatus Latescibacteria bacterium ADurb.Bin168]|nr:MAG: hypothetical protein BWY06_00707 [Candidatus Latescibacteria bacterium ADurb.Bin168]